jgi:hypothetical protein
MANRRIAENEIFMHASLDGLHRNQESEWSPLANHILRKYDQKD